MMETIPVNTLVQNSLPATAIAQEFLPDNNNSSFLKLSDVNTVTILDKKNRHPVAFGSLIQCNKKQAYCMLGAVADDYKDNLVWVEEVKTAKNGLNTFLEITDRAPLADYSGETLFEQVFADREGRPVHLHLLDTLIEKSIGTLELDVSKNITVDILNEESEVSKSEQASWRDTVGFVVSDRYLYEAITVNRFELLALEKEESKVKIEAIDEEKMFPMLDFDAELTIYNRSEYLTALVQTADVKGKIAITNGMVNGYVLTKGNRILQCYGEDEETKNALLVAAAADVMAPEVSMYVRVDSSPTINHLIQAATKRTRITRLHTRTVSTNVKWNKVACLNIGLHIF